jgi:sensor histidine kinase YesM
MLHLAVADDGPGVGRNGTSAGEAGHGEGIGLANTRLRLQQLYGDRHRFHLESSAAGGTVVHIALPQRAAPVA